MKCDIGVIRSALRWTWRGYFCAWQWRERSLAPSICCKSVSQYLLRCRLMGGILHELKPEQVSRKGSEDIEGGRNQCQIMEINGSHRWCSGQNLTQVTRLPVTSCSNFDFDWQSQSSNVQGISEFLAIASQHITAYSIQHRVSRRGFLRWSLNPISVPNVGRIESKVSPFFLSRESWEASFGDWGCCIVSTN